MELCALAGLSCQAFCSNRGIVKNMEQISIFYGQQVRGQYISACQKSDQSTLQSYVSETEQRLLTRPKETERPSRSWSLSVVLLY